MDETEPIVVELLLSPDEYRQLSEVASQRQESPESVAREAIAEWLKDETELEKGRALMRELGHGLGKGPEMNNFARDHDAILYGRPD